MRAMQYPDYGSEPRLVDLPVPEAAPTEVRVRVAYTSVNPVDWKQASGKIRLLMPQRRPCVPGYDLSGVVDAVGEQVKTFTIGDRVHIRIPMSSAGANAEYAAVPADHAARLPDAMDLVTGAALPLAGMTALQGLRDVLGLDLGGDSRRLLVIGASGGVGHFAVQIAAATGAEVVGVCSGRNADLVRSLGCRDVIDYTRPGCWAGVTPFDLVYDCVAGDPAPYLVHLKRGGAYASCMPSAATFLNAVNLLGGKRVRPVLLHSNAADLGALDQLFVAGKLRAVVDRHFALEELAAAWAHSRSGRACGKIIIDVAT